jgi:hypothetical protein
MLRESYCSREQSRSECQSAGEGIEGRSFRGVSLKTVPSRGASFPNSSGLVMCARASAGPLPTARKHVRKSRCRSSTSGSFQSAVDRVAMGGPVRLDLGAGHKHEDGWVRVDFAVDRKKCSITGNGVTKEGRPLLPDVEADLRSLPFPDDYADEARAIHVIEHFQVWEAPNADRVGAGVEARGGAWRSSAPASTRSSSSSMCRTSRRT